ncbi:MAG: hypothetical protein ACE5LC_02730 [Candidatus Aminicenantales bacterium]
MRKEREQSIVAQAEEIGEMVDGLIKRMSFPGREVEILTAGLKKKAAFLVYNIRQSLSTIQYTLCRRYLLKALSDLYALSYYNYVSRRVGCFSSGPYLSLAHKLEELKKRIQFLDKALRMKEGTRPRPFLPPRDGLEEKTSISLEPGRGG